MCSRWQFEHFCYHLTGSAQITNGKARVTVKKLECNATTYTIIAGGTLNGRLLGPTSLGPRLLHEDLNTSICEEVVTKKKDDRGTKSLDANNYVCTCIKCNYMCIIILTWDWPFIHCLKCTHRRGGRHIKQVRPLYV